MFFITKFTLTVLVWQVYVSAEVPGFWEGYINVIQIGVYLFPFYSPHEKELETFRLR